MLGSAIGLKHLVGYVSFSSVKGSFDPTLQGFHSALQRLLRDDLSD